MSDIVTGKDVQDLFKSVKKGLLRAPSETKGVYTPDEIINLIDWMREMKEEV